MKLFGRKRHQERQRAYLDRIETNRDVGFKYGVELFRMDHPRPPFQPSPDPFEHTFRVAVQHGYTEAENQFCDSFEQAWFHDQVDEAVEGFYGLFDEQETA